MSGGQARCAETEMEAMRDTIRAMTAEQAADGARIRALEAENEELRGRVADAHETLACIGGRAACRCKVCSP